VIGIAVPVLPTLLAACGARGGSTGAELAVGTPSEPVQQSLFEDNAAIESDLEPEAGPLQIYNWADYINPDIIPVAEEALGVDIEIATYFNEEEALAKLSSGEVAYDVWFPTSQRVAVAVAAQLIQPINHDYLPNLSANVWPQLADPYYDKGSRYSVPYVTYTTGIAWRNDMADSADIEGQANPWDVFWNSKYVGDPADAASVLYDPSLRTALTQSLTLAVLTMLVATPIGVALAIGLARWRGRGAKPSNLLMLFPLVTPEIVMGVALFLVFDNLYDFVPFGTGAQFLGHVTFSISFVVVIVRGRLFAIGRDYEEAPMDLGASPWEAMRRVLLPLLAPRSARLVRHSLRIVDR
jgi:ABC-type glycerol-3-phosphate transport system permease component